MARDFVGSGEEWRRKKREGTRNHRPTFLWISNSWVKADIKSLQMETARSGIFQSKPFACSLVTCRRGFTLRCVQIFYKNADCLRCHSGQAKLLRLLLS